MGAPDVAVSRASVDAASSAPPMAWTPMPGREQRGGGQPILRPGRPANLGGGRAAPRPNALFGALRRPAFRLLCSAAWALCLAAALAGCAPIHHLKDPSQLCVELPSRSQASPDLAEGLIAELDGILGDIGYIWSQRGTSRTMKHRWHVSEPKRGVSGPQNRVVMAMYMEAPRRDPESCQLWLDVYADGRRQGELDWRAFFLLKNRALPALLPGATVRVVTHPAFGARPWDVPALAARFAPEEPLPEEIRRRIEAHQSRSAAGRWRERASAAVSAAWRRTVVAHTFGVSLYFLFPLNWIVFLVFAAAAAAGRRLIRSPRVRRAGFVALAVLLLTPVKVPTWAGATLLPQGLFLAMDFHLGHYVRNPGFSLAALALTGILFWLLVRRRRKAEGEPGSPPVPNVNTSANQPGSPPGPNANASAEREDPAKH